MKKGNILLLKGTSLKIMNLMMFFMVVHLIVPKIADATGTFRTLKNNVFCVDPEKCSINPGKTSQSLKTIGFKAQSNIDFVPPNYSGPDSMHGSGTR